MKNKIFSASVVALVSLAVVSCDDYNDQFNIDESITDVRTATITLASGDYSSIASNATNIAIAERLDQEAGTGTAYADALAAVGTNGYFTTLASPEDYIPAFLASSNDYRLADVGSRFTVNVNFYKDPSGYLSDLVNIGTYDFTSYDYETAWGGSKASYLTPSTVSAIPDVLASAFPEAQEGDLVAVNYAYSNFEPTEGDNSSAAAAAYSVAPRAEGNYNNISDVIANTEGGEYSISGTIVATYARGFLVNDGTGTILVYLNATPNYSVGDIVSVTGTTTQYSGLMQFPATSVISLLGRADSFSYPTEPVSMDGAALDAYIDSPSIQYVSYTGTLSISGYYYNVTVDGAATATGSIQYPVSGVVDSSFDGQQVTVTGYLIGVSGGRYTNTMVTTVALADGSSPEYTPVGEIAYADGGTYSARGVVAATYGRGFLLTDGSGYILVYKSGTGVAVGDMVTVSGDISAYAGFNQFSSAATVTNLGAGEYTMPAPRQLDGAAMDAYLTAPYIALVSYEGTLNIDGNYYNVIVDGASTAQGSLSYPENMDAALNGRTVAVTGYAIGVSGSRYFNTMVTSVEGVGGVVSMPNTSELYVYDGTSWSEYSIDAASAVVLDPTAYEQYGSDEISSDAVDAVAATYLVQKLPYAQDGALAALVYNSGEMSVKEYTLTAGAWIPTPAYEEQQFIFEHKAEGWSADMSTYINESFIGSTGGFEIKDVALDGLSYVWALDGTYGWKASAYAASTNHATESWIVSPVINLSRATAPKMQFETALNYWTGAVTDFCAVMVSTNYTGDVTAADWTELTVTGWPTSASWTFYTVDLIDLSQFNGDRVYVAFRYKSRSDAAPTWEIKNLKIAESEEFGGGETGGEGGTAE